MPGGYVGHVSTTTCKCLTFVLLDAHVCNVEGCGFIADVLSLFVNNHLGIRLDCCVPCRCCRSKVVLTEGGDPCPLDREICA
jgi:hypothetical protein